MHGVQACCQWRRGEVEGGGPEADVLSSLPCGYRGRSHTQGAGRVVPACMSSGSRCLQCGAASALIVSNTCFADTLPARVVLTAWRAAGVEVAVGQQVCGREANFPAAWNVPRKSVPCIHCDSCDRPSTLSLAAGLVCRALASRRASHSHPTGVLIRPRRLYKQSSKTASGLCCRCGFAELASQHYLLANDAV